MPRPEWIIGIDEAGRGPLAGPVYVAAVAVRSDILRSLKKLDIKDSKKLLPAKREEWLEWMREKEGDILRSFSFSSHSYIDRAGIVPAISEALNRALQSLSVDPEQASVFLDGSLKAPPVFKRQRTIIKGDEKHKVIALASIVAKVERDNLMKKYALKFPDYGFERHVGYGTREHRDRIKEIGLCEIHRKSYCRSWV